MKKMGVCVTMCNNEGDRNKDRKTVKYVLCLVLRPVNERDAENSQDLL